MNFNMISGFRALVSGPLSSEFKATLVVGAGFCLAFVVWLWLLFRLLRLVPGKISFNKVMLWTFWVPGFNLLWVPWALLSTNHLVKRIDERYSRINLFHSALGIRILSIPLLMLYLLWFGVASVLWKSYYKDSDPGEMLILTTIVVVCMLIVLMSYLVHLSLFIAKIVDYYKHLKKQQRSS